MATLRKLQENLRRGWQDLARGGRRCYRQTRRALTGLFHRLGANREARQ